MTDFAVLNFVFGAFGILGLRSLWVAYSQIASGANGAGAPVQDAPMVPDEMGVTTQQDSRLLLVALVLALISVILLVLSGVGYLKQKKLMGRLIGCIYGIIAVASAVISLVLGHTIFGIGTVIGLIYPVLTLVLLNSVFRKDFINP